MYTVIHDFCDMTDKKHVYRVGDKFPRNGVTVTKERIAELASSKNKIGKPLIEVIKEEAEEVEVEVEKPKPKPKSKPKKKKAE